jgi:hypothetical protein
LASSDLAGGDDAFDRATSRSPATHSALLSSSFQNAANTPPSRSTRAISGNARFWSNQWKACPATTASTEPFGGTGNGGHAGVSRDQFAAHFGIGFDGDRRGSGGKQTLGEFAGTGAEIEDNERALAAERLQRPLDGSRWIVRSMFGIIGCARTE